MQLKDRGFEAETPNWICAHVKRTSWHVPNQYKTEKISIWFQIVKERAASWSR